MNSGAETHLAGGVMSAFCFSSTAIARVPHFTNHWQYSSQERPTKFLTTLPMIANAH